MGRTLAGDAIIKPLNIEPVCHSERSEESLIYFLTLIYANRNQRCFAPLNMTIVKAHCDVWRFESHFLRSHNEMDHAIWRGDEEAVKIFAQLLDFVASRDAMNFQK